MIENIKAVHYDTEPDTAKPSVDKYGLETAKRIKAFHESFPGYETTPLVHLKNLSGELGVDGIYVKDESYRFGLNAFKGLGGSYCIGKYIADRLELDMDQLTYEIITSEKVKDKLGEITFVTATDGNHGRGIAWTAHVLGQKAVVYMPKGSAEERLENIRKLGAEAWITDLNYDETVAFAAECEKKYGWVLVQDTAWDGYETIPGWIMEGYTTMAYEAVTQLQNVRPTHIFLQAGVGAMAGALTGFFTDYYKDSEKPIITIVEANKADCIFQTAQARDGELHAVEGPMDTIMAGLACGIPCTIGWEILSNYADHFISMPDYIAAKGMRVLGNPLGNDERVTSGESGAATLGFVVELMQKEGLEELRSRLKIGKESKILIFSTEGDTDQTNYRRIVWDGMYPCFQSGREYRKIY